MMRNELLRSKLFAVLLTTALTWALFVSPVEADWTDWADMGVDMILKKTTPMLLDGLRYWLSDSPIGELLDKAANGDREAQFALGLMYYQGDGVEENHYEAADWWYRAAENGHSKAQFLIGVAYCSGDGVKQDKNEGIKWIKMAAEQGDVDAIKWLSKERKPRGRKITR